MTLAASENNIKPNTFIYIYLNDLCSCRGAVLILGGIMLNVWAAALLFQPVEEHMVKKYKEVEEDEDVPQVGYGFGQASVGVFCYRNRDATFIGELTFVLY